MGPDYPGNPVSYAKLTREERRLTD